MDIKAIETNYNIRVQTKKEVTGKIRSRIRRYEKKYGLSSERMEENIRAGIMVETPEINRWMQDYHLIGCISLVTRKKTAGQARVE